jgi:hypothetical protein
LEGGEGLRRGRLVSGAWTTSGTLSRVWTRSFLRKCLFKSGADSSLLNRTLTPTLTGTRSLGGFKKFLFGSWSRVDTGEVDAFFWGREFKLGKVEILRRVW